MISFTTAKGSAVLGFRISGKLSAQDYEEVLIPAIEARIQETGKVRVLLEWGDDFAGWEAKAMLDDARLGLAHWNDFEKVALIGAPRWANFFAKMFDAISKGSVKIFDEGEYDQALAWAEV